MLADSEAIKIKLTQKEAIKGLLRQLGTRVQKQI